MTLTTLSRAARQGAAITLFGFSLAVGLGIVSAWLDNRQSQRETRRWLVTENRRLRRLLAEARAAGEQP